MTNKEKDFINTLAKKILQLSREQEDDYEYLTKHLARLYTLSILTAACVLLISLIK